MEKIIYNRIFVGGLNETINEDDLRALFGQYGEIKEVHLKDRGAKKDEIRRGHGFITYKNAQQAAVALQEGKGECLMIRGVHLNVRQAVRRTTVHDKDEAVPKRNQSPVTVSPVPEMDAHGRFQGMTPAYWNHIQWMHYYAMINGWPPIYPGLGSIGCGYPQILPTPPTPSPEPFLFGGPIISGYGSNCSSPDHNTIGCDCEQPDCVESLYAQRQGIMSEEFGYNRRPEEHLNINFGMTHVHCDMDATHGQGRKCDCGHFKRSTMMALGSRSAEPHSKTSVGERRGL